MLSEVPLSPQPQTFSIPILGTTYQFTVKWNTFGNNWLLDIGDSNGNPIATGIPLVTGSNLLEQLDYLGLGFGLYCATDADLLAVPTFANLGVAGHLFVSTP